MAATVSPVHKAIDPRRWDAERLLGRLVIVVHAAFLDAGFVPVPHRSRKPGPVPKQAGRAASALSIRYGAPQLLQRQDAEAAVAVLRIRAHGRRLVLYVQCEPWPVECCVLVDALAAAPLLAGGLDRTARALRSDARTAALWRRLSEDLCRRALVDVCRWSGAALEPSFMSLPGDAKAVILARLADGADLARVELACAGLRRVVAQHDRELWKPRYDALCPASWIDGSDGSPERCWKERYVKARRWQQATSRLQAAPPFPFRPINNEVMLSHLRELWREKRRPADPEDSPELPADPVAGRRRWRAAERGKHAGHQTPPYRGQEKRRRGAGAIHAPSSRYRWNTGDSMLFTMYRTRHEFKFTWKVDEELYY